MNSFIRRIRLYFQGYDTEVFVSYAWNDKNTASGDREYIVDELCKSLMLDGFNIIRDKTEVKYTDEYSILKQWMGSGRFIVVVISDKYLKSVNCMSELLEIYRNADSEIATLKEKIFPIVLDDVKIYTPLERLAYLKHWEKEINELQDETKKHNGSKMPKTFDVLRLYEDISFNMDYFTHLLSDMNTLNVKLLSHNSFQEVKKAIIQRTIKKTSRSVKRRRKRISITISVAVSVTVLVAIYPYLRKPKTIEESEVGIQSKELVNTPITSTQSTTSTPTVVTIPPIPIPERTYVTIHGLVTDDATGYPLDSVIVFINDTKCVTQEGKYSLKIYIPKGFKKEDEMILACKYYKPGYEEIVYKVSPSIQQGGSIRLDEVRLNQLNQIP